MIILRGIRDAALSIELKKLPIFQLIKSFVQKHCRVLVLRFLVKNVHPVGSLVADSSGSSYELAELQEVRGHGAYHYMHSAAILNICVRPKINASALGSVHDEGGVFRILLEGK